MQGLLENQRNRRGVLQAQGLKSLHGTPAVGHWIPWHCVNAAELTGSSMVQHVKGYQASQLHRLFAHTQGRFGELQGHREVIVPGLQGRENRLNSVL